MSAHAFTLPDVGEGLGEGEIVRWLVAEGDTVAVDQIIVEVQTDKAIVEIPAPVAGVITRLGGQPNDILPIGAVLAVIEVAGDAGAGAPGAAASPQGGAPGPASAATALAVAAAAAAGSGGTGPDSGIPGRPAGGPDSAGGPSPGGAPGTPQTGGRRVRASPATRKRARALGIDLASVTPSGSHGQVTRADVARAAATAASGTAPEVAGAVGATAPAAPAPATAAAPAAPRPQPVAAEGRVEPLRGLRRQIALAMDEAWRTVPHIFSMDDLDATALVAARRALNEDLAGEGLKLSFLPFFIKACAAALRAHPRFNASIDLAAERIVYHPRISIGIATQTAEGLIVPVVHDPDAKSVVDLGREIDALARLARERRLGLAQLAGATFSISNYGSYGAHMGTPIIRPPQSAIAGFGRIADAVVPVDGAPAVRPRLPYCLSADHRLNDGEDLGRFTATMTRYLSEPVRMLALA